MTWCHQAISHFLNQCPIIVYSINIQIFTWASLVYRTSRSNLYTKGSTLTHESLVTKMLFILQTTYPNGFLQWFSLCNFPIQQFYFLDTIYILLSTDLISSIFSQHLNIFTRASHHWCLASNIVLVYFMVRDTLRYGPHPLGEIVSYGLFVECKITNISAFLSGVICSGICFDVAS